MPTWSAYRLRTRAAPSVRLAGMYYLSYRSFPENMEWNSRKVRNWQKRVRVEDVGFDKPLEQIPRHLELLVLFYAAGSWTRLVVAVGG